MHPINMLAVSSQVRVEAGLQSRLLAKWHLLSLDAPTVAAVWTWFVARSSGVALPWQSAAAMFVAVWVLYAADRLLDARGTCGLEERHRFHRRHDRWFRLGITAGCLALALLLPSLSSAAVRLYLVLGALLIAWFVVIHSFESPARPLPKEFVVGVFFAAAVFVPVVARRPELQRQLLVPAVLLGLLCCLNCLFIFSWEHAGLGEARGNRFTLTAVDWVLWLGAALVFFCLLDRQNPIAKAVGIAALLLMAVHRMRRRLERTTLRAIADLVLLTPLVTAWWR